MKFKHMIMATAALVLSVACNRDEYDIPNETGDRYTLTSQDQISSFVPSEDVNTVHIIGEGITDISSLNLKTAKNLIIENTSIVSLSIPELESVSVSLQILGNEKLVDLNGLAPLKFFSGEFIVHDNPVLTDISGIMNIKVCHYGSMSIIGNASLGENVYPLPSDDFGFGPIRYLIKKGLFTAEKVILQKNHPKAVTDPTQIGLPVGLDYVDYELKSHLDVQNFSNFNKDGLVNNLTITGNDITGNDVLSLEGKITEIKGDFSLINSGIGGAWNLGDFFGGLKFHGGFIIKNDKLNNINNFQKLQKEIKGDFILENCPGLDFGWNENRPKGAGFQLLSKVGGDVIIKCPLFVSGGLRDLAEVGGDFIIENATGQPWNKFVSFAGMLNIRRIGGKVIIKNNKNLTSLAGLDKLEAIDGDEITIIANLSKEATEPGFSIVKTWLDNGVITNPNAKITLQTSSGEKVDITTLQAYKPAK